MNFSIVGINHTIISKVLIIISLFLFCNFFTVPNVEAVEDCSQATVVSGVCHDFCSDPTQMIIGSDYYNTCYACIAVSTDECNQRNTGAGVQTNAQSDYSSVESALSGLNQIGGSTASQYRPGDPAGQSNIQLIIGRLISFSLSVVGGYALVMCIYAGFIWMTQGSEPEARKKALNILLWSALGIIVALFAYVLVGFIFSAFAP